MSKLKEIFKEKLNFKESFHNWKAKNQEKKDLKQERKQSVMQSDEIMDLTAKLNSHKKNLLIIWGIVIGVIVIIMIGYSIYNYIRVFNHYTVLTSTKRQDVAATKYIEISGNILKYSPDGVSYMNGSNDVLWSTTYSMQSPIVDVCGTTVAVADQKGTQVYIFDESGQIGQFQTIQPILKVKVAEQGVVAAVLEESDVTWINIYDTKGTEIAKNRTSISDSGYPMDAALSPDGLKLMVSYLRVEEEKMSTKVIFYNFDSVGQNQTNNEVSSFLYNNTVVPKTVFLNNSTAVAFRDNGITIFKGSQIPEETTKIDINQEIISIFHDEQNLGIVLKSDDPKHKYLMQLYNTSGKMTMQKYFDLDYSHIKVDGTKILMSSEGKVAIFSTGGKEIFSGSYEKPVIELISSPGFRRYTVITQSTTDQIRLK